LKPETGNSKLHEGGVVAEQKFEDAFQKLESIVKKLEDGNLSLEESLKAFEEGVRLSRLCSKKLDEAEKKVEILLKDSGGRLVPKPFSLQEEGD
jgi:exodeoxyribonuclease VII small subunit